MALMSGKVYSNTGAPSNVDGDNGDIYMRLDGLKTTYRKELGAWIAVGSTLGAIPEFISGVGVPSNSLGADEQYYRDTDNQDLYYKQGSTWNLVGNLQGTGFEGQLQQAGIGLDLGAGAPNHITAGSLNAVTTAGEYQYEGSVSDIPYAGFAGNLKVWRASASSVLQWTQPYGSEKTAAYRETADGGSTWTAWAKAALRGGDSTVQFSVAAATSAAHAVRLDQILEFARHNGYFHDDPNFPLTQTHCEFDIPINYPKQSTELGVIRVCIDKYTGGLTNGTVSLTSLNYSFIYGVFTSPIYNVNANDGGAAITQIKTATTTEFTFSSSVENEAVDTFLASGLDFYWVAIGLVA